VRKVRVRGKQHGVDKEFVFEVDFPALAEQHTFVPTLWARQHTASLLDAIRRTGQKQELVDEVRRLATRYGIVTPYTSQLIVEEGMRLAGAPVPDRVPVDWATGRVGAGGAAGDPAPSGPTTGGPAGPGAAKLADLGRARTGAEAVEESLQVGSDSFYIGAARSSERKDKGALGGKSGALVRLAAGRTFVVLGEDLVEQGLSADWPKQAVVIETFSDAWFALLKQNPKLREVLALGERIVFRDGERIVHCKPAASAEPKPGEVPAPQPPVK